MGTCCSKFTGYEHLRCNQKDELNSVFKGIASKAAVDLSNPEIQDIQSAVFQMLDRIKTGINERGVFSISRIEPCGSMVEMTAMWKYDKRPIKEPYIEFDFLAVLQTDCDIEPDCQECFYVNTLPINLELLGKYHCNLYKHGTNTENVIDAFKRETNHCLISLCSCLEVKYVSDILTEYESFEFGPASAACSNNQQNCDKCALDTPTGTLRVKPSVVISGYENNCSLIFDWTSRAKTLCTRDQWCLPGTEKMDNLTIHIDFLPALESFQSYQQSADAAEFSPSGLVLNPPSSDFEHYCFLVPKHCVVCDKNKFKYTWRRSGCRAEIDTFVNKMSDKHRKCYQVLKHIPHGINSYNLKIAILHHNSSCSDAGEDFARCVFEVLDELLQAYKTKQLKSFHSQSNLLNKERINYCKYFSERISLLKEAICYAVNESESVSSFLDKVDNYLCYN